MMSHKKMERRARIELATLAWKAKVIPFYERRVCLIIQQTVGLVYLFGRGTWNRTKADEFKARCATITLYPNMFGSQYKI
jgi:hypothetical protein